MKFLKQVLYSKGQHEKTADKHPKKLSSDSSPVGRLHREKWVGTKLVIAQSCSTVV